ncbi:GTP pyrophosphokinase family protein [Candidatus Saccharibacteria bacterium]|nr:GTP pyrophosphokinase family protein [Candidatus Saccharibacteria bacterium]
MDIKTYELEKQYEAYAKECQCGMRTVMARLENLKSEMELSPERSPFKSISSRIKDFDSAVEKCKRKGLDINLESFKNMHDIAGVRIIVPYQDDIYTVRNAVIRQPSMTVVDERDYVEKPKPNGYRSLHLIVEMEIYFMETSKRVPVEIQIRTEAMELWASQEHRLRYKNDDPSPEAVNRFSIIAQILADFDKQAMELRDFRTEEEGDIN